MIEERAFWLAWSQIEGIGPILLQRLQKQFGRLSTAWEASATDLLAVEGFGRLTIETILTTKRSIDPEALLQDHLRQNPHFWTPADPDYPRLLLETPDPPATLYYRGQVNLVENQGLMPMVAIVGTRSPSDYGRRWTRRLAATLVQNGFTVVSGLAEGVDTEAHRSCVEANGRTLAVMGTGVNLIYPWSNRALSQQVLQQGLLLSEYPADTQPDRVHFPRRNRIIAGLSRATIVTEAPQKSGALITAYLANDYGRDVYVLPGSLDNPKAIGCLDLLHKGAQVILSESHLLEMLGTLPKLPTAAAQISLPLDLPPDQEKVLAILTNLLQERNGEAVSLDLVVQRSSLTTAAVSNALLNLELSGLVTNLPGMRYQRS